MGGPDTSRMKSDIHAQEMILRQLCLQLDQLYLDWDRIQHASTWRGRYDNLMGYLFSVYCVFKVLSSFISLILQRQGQMDTVTRLLNHMVHYWHVEIDIDFWAGQISFVMVTVMAVVSIRGLLIQFARLSSKIPGTLASDDMVLLLSLMMGFYFQSAVLLIRTHLPLAYR